MSADTIRDLSVLATMNEIGTTLKSPGLQKQFANFMRGTMAQLTLPRGVEMHFEEQHAGSHA
jgi:hypothetical protein